MNTEVIRIRRKSFLSKFNRKNGWYVNWGKLVEEYEVYALVLEHYMEKLKATHVGILHPYQFCIFEDEMQDIIKTYTYAYSGEEI